MDKSVAALSNEIRLAVAACRDWRRIRCLGNDTVKDTKEVSREVFAVRCFQAFMKGVLVAFPSKVVSTILDPRRCPPTEDAGIAYLYRWMLCTSSTRGKAFMVKAMKDELSRLRKIGLGGPSNSFTPFIRRVFRGKLALQGYRGRRFYEVCFQISRISRSFPRGDSQLAKETLKVHRRNLTTPFSTNEVDLRLLRNFVEEKVVRLSETAVEFKLSTHFSLSACSSSSRKEGGLFGHTRRVSEELRSSLLSEDDLSKLSAEPLGGVLGFRRLSVSSFNVFLDRPPQSRVRRDECLWLWDKSYAEDYGVTLEDWEIIREYLFALEAVIADDYRFGSFEPVPIFERGYKVRVVTKCPPGLVVLTHFVSSLLMDLLRRDPLTRASVTVSDQRAEFVERFNSTIGRFDLPRDFVFRSADLTSATDLMPHDLCQAIGDGVLEGFSRAGLHLPEVIRDAFRYCLGSVDMLYDGETVPTKRGILMGLPPTWPILSLYNMFLHDRAWKESSVYRSLGGYYRLCSFIGDDYTMYGPREVSRNYTRALIRTGGRPSVLKDCESEKALVLGEEAAYLKGKRLAHVQTCSVRLLCGDLEWTKEVDNPLLHLPVALTSASDAFRPSRRKEFIGTVQRELAGVISRFSKAGIPPCLPRSVGGGGFPCANVNAEFRKNPGWARAVRWCISRVVQGHPEDGLRLERLTRCWTEIKVDVCSSQWAAQRLDDHVKEFGHVSLKDRPDSITRADAYSRLLSFMRGGEELAMGVVPVNARYLSLGVLGRALKRVIRDINSKIPPGRLSDPVEDLDTGVKKWKDVYEESFRVLDATGSVFRAPFMSFPRHVRPTSVDGPSLKRRKLC